MSFIAIHQSSLRTFLAIFMLIIAQGKGIAAQKEISNSLPKCVGQWEQFSDWKKLCQGKSAQCVQFIEGFINEHKKSPHETCQKLAILMDDYLSNARKKKNFFPSLYRAHADVIRQGNEIIYPPKPDPAIQKQLEEERQRREEAEAQVEEERRRQEEAERRVAELTKQLRTYEQIQEEERSKQETIRALRENIAALKEEIEELKHQLPDEVADHGGVDLELLDQIAELEKEIQSQQGELDNLVNPKYEGPAAGLMYRGGAGVGLPYDYSEEMLRTLHRPMRYLNQFAAQSEGEESIAAGVFPLTVESIKDGNEVNSILEGYKDLIQEDGLSIIKRGPISAEDLLPLKAYLTKPEGIPEAELQGAKESLSARLETMRTIFINIGNAKDQYEAAVKNLELDNPGFLNLDQIFKETTPSDGMVQHFNMVLANFFDKDVFVLVEDIQALQGEVEKYIQGVQLGAFLEEWWRVPKRQGVQFVDPRDILWRGHKIIFERLSGDSQPEGSQAVADLMGGVRNILHHLVELSPSIYTQLKRISDTWNEKASDPLREDDGSYFAYLLTEPKAHKTLQESGRALAGLLPLDEPHTNGDAINSALEPLIQQASYQALQLMASEGFEDAMERALVHQAYMKTLSNKYLELIVLVKEKLVGDISALYSVSQAPHVVKVALDPARRESITRIMGDVYQKKFFHSTFSFSQDHVALFLPSAGDNLEEENNLSQLDPLDAFNLKNQHFNILKDSVGSVSMTMFGVAVEKAELIEKAKKAYQNFLQGVRNSEILSVRDLASVLKKTPKTLGALLQYARIYSQYFTDDLLNKDDMTNLVNADTQEGWLLELRGEKRKIMESFLHDLAEASRFLERQASAPVSLRRDQYLRSDFLVSENHEGKELDRFKTLLSLHNLYQTAQDAIRSVNLVGGKELLEGFRVSDLLQLQSASHSVPLPPPPPPPAFSPASLIQQNVANPGVRKLSLRSALSLYEEVIEGLNNNNWLEIVSKDEGSFLRASLELDWVTGERTKNNVDKLFQYQRMRYINEYFRQGLLLLTVIYECLFEQLLPEGSRKPSDFWKEFYFAEERALYFYNNQYPSHQTIRDYVLNKLIDANPSVQDMGARLSKVYDWLISQKIHIMPLASEVMPQISANLKAHISRQITEILKSNEPEKLWEVSLNAPPPARSDGVLAEIGETVIRVE